MALSSGWVASTSEVLEENIRSMIWSYSIDEISIPKESFVRKEFSSFTHGGNHPGVNFYTILNKWALGVHHAQSGWTVDTVLNDGFSDYQPSNKNHIINSTIFVFNGETKEKDYKKWPVIYQEDFTQGPTNWSSGKMGYEGDDITYNIVDGKFVFSIEKVDSRLGQSKEYGVISSDKYFLSIDTKFIDMSGGKSPCFGFSFNQNKSVGSGFPVNFAGICNMDGKAALKVDEYLTATVGKSSLVLLHEDLTNITNLSLLVNGRNVQYFVNEKKVYEKYIPGIAPGRTFGFYIEFLPGSSMHFEIDNFKIAMPVNLSDLQITSTP